MIIDQEMRILFKRPKNGNILDYQEVVNGVVQKIQAGALQDKPPTFMTFSDIRLCTADDIEDVDAVIIGETGNTVDEDCECLVVDILVPIDEDEDDGPFLNKDDLFELDTYIEEAITELL